MAVVYFGVIMGGRYTIAKAGIYLNPQHVTETMSVKRTTTPPVLKRSSKQSAEQPNKSKLKDISLPEPTSKPSTNHTSRPLSMPKGNTLMKLTKKPLAKPIGRSLAMLKGNTSGNITEKSLSEPTRNSELQRYLCVYLMGRLGNLMFQFASLVGIARLKGMIPVIPYDSELLKIFKLNITLVNKQVCESFPRHSERRPCAFDKGSIAFQNSTSNYRLFGYLQSWRYFDNVVGELKSQFTLKDEILTKAKNNILRSLANVQHMKSTSNTTFVGIHVRRGDMIKEDKVLFGYKVATRDYFLHAMNLFRVKYRDIVFVVCSNDMQWFHAVIPHFPDVVFSSSQEPEVDMATLALCNHTIMSVGTYGWWASWLSGGTTMYYKYQFRQNTTLATQFNLSDYMYPSWIGMK